MLFFLPFLKKDKNDSHRIVCEASDHFCLAVWCLTRKQNDMTKSWHRVYHSLHSIWRCYHAQPSPCWSEANLPTPPCRILGIAAHRAAVMCHLALGSIGQELSLTSPLKLVCHWAPRWGRVSEGHLRAFSPWWGLTRGRLPTPIGEASLASSSQKAHKLPGPKNHAVADQRLSIW